MRERVHRTPGGAIGKAPSLVLPPESLSGGAWQSAFMKKMPSVDLLTRPRINRELRENLLRKISDRNLEMGNRRDYGVVAELSTGSPMRATNALQVASYDIERRIGKLEKLLERETFGASGDRDSLDGPDFDDSRKIATSIILEISRLYRLKAEYHYSQSLILITDCRYEMAERTLELYVDSRLALAETHRLLGEMFMKHSRRDGQREFAKAQRAVADAVSKSFARAGLLLLMDDVEGMEKAVKMIIRAADEGISMWIRTGKEAEAERRQLNDNTPIGEVYSRWNLGPDNSHIYGRMRLVDAETGAKMVLKWTLEGKTGEPGKKAMDKAAELITKAVQSDEINVSDADRRAYMLQAYLESLVLFLRTVSTEALENAHKQYHHGETARSSQFLSESAALYLRTAWVDEMIIQVTEAAKIIELKKPRERQKDAMAQAWNAWRRSHSVLMEWRDGGIEP